MRHGKEKLDSPLSPLLSQSQLAALAEIDLSPEKSARMRELAMKAKAWEDARIEQRQKTDHFPTQTASAVETLKRVKWTKDFFNPKETT